MLPSLRSPLPGRAGWMSFSCVLGLIAMYPLLRARTLLMEVAAPAYKEY